MKFGAIKATLDPFYTKLIRRLCFDYDNGSQRDVNSNADTLGLLRSDVAPSHFWSTFYVYIYAGLWYMQGIRYIRGYGICRVENFRENGSNTEVGLSIRGGEEWI